MLLSEFKLLFFVENDGIYSKKLNFSNQKRWNRVSVFSRVLLIAWHEAYHMLHIELRILTQNGRSKEVDRLRDQIPDHVVAQRPATLCDDGNCRHAECSPFLLPCACRIKNARTSSTVACSCSGDDEIYQRHNSAFSI